MRSKRDVVETRQDRAALVADAGLGRVSFVSVLAGTLVAYGAFAVLAGVAAAITKAVGIDTNLSTNDWHRWGAAAAVAACVVLLCSYYFGGYVTGRMARRAGSMNGLLVFFLGIVIAVGVAGMARLFSADDAVLRNLRSIGVPTSRSEWTQIGTFAGIGSLVAMLLGALAGGAAGERWHGKLLRRALDPGIGPEAEAHTVASTRHDEAVARVDKQHPARLIDDGTSTMTRSDHGIDLTDRPPSSDLTLDEEREHQREHQDH